MWEPSISYSRFRDSASSAGNALRLKDINFLIESAKSCNDFSIGLADPGGDPPKTKRLQVFPRFRNHLSEQGLQSRTVVKQTIILLWRCRVEGGDLLEIDINRMIRLSRKQMMGNDRPTGLILIRGRKVDRESFHRRYMWHATRGRASRKRFCIFRRPFLAYGTIFIADPAILSLHASDADIPIPNSTLCLTVNAQIFIFYSNRMT